MAILEGTTGNFYPSIEVDYVTAAEFFFDVVDGSIAPSNSANEFFDIEDTAQNIINDFPSLLADAAAIPGFPYSVITFTIEDTPEDIVDNLDALQGLLNLYHTPYDGSVPSTDVNEANVLYNLELEEGLPYDGNAAWYQPLASGTIDLISVFIEGPGGSEISSLPVTFSQFYDFIGHDGGLLLATNREDSPLFEGFILGLAINDTAENIEDFFDNQIDVDQNPINQVLLTLRGQDAKSITEESSLPVLEGTTEGGLFFSANAARQMGDFAADLSRDGISLTLQEGDLIGVSDDDTNIQQLTGAQILELGQGNYAAIVVNITSDGQETENGSLIINADQAMGLAQAYQNYGLTIQLSNFGDLEISDTAENIEKLSADDIKSLSGSDDVSDPSDNGAVDADVTSILADGTLVFDADQAAALADAHDSSAGMTIEVPDGYSIVLEDDSDEIENLSPANIAALAQLHFNVISSDDGSLYFDAGQTEALIDNFVGSSGSADDFKITVPDGSGVFLSDTADNIEADLNGSDSTNFADGLAALDYTGINSAGTLSLTVQSAEALIAAFDGKEFSLSALDEDGDQDSVAVDDSADSVETLSPSDITTLVQMGVDIFAADDASLVFDADQAKALADADADCNLTVSVPDGDTVGVTDEAATLEAELDPDTIQGLADLKFDAVTSTDDSLDFKVDQADALISGFVSDDGLAVDGLLPVSDLTISVPGGQELTVTGTSVDIESEINGSAEAAAGFVGGLVALGFDEIVSDDSLAFDVNAGIDLADAYKDSGLLVSAPDGDTVSIRDTAALIESLTADEITELGHAGLTAIAATDTSVIFDDDQALALLAANVQVSAPAGDQVSVEGTVQQIESLEEHDEIDPLKALGVTDFIVKDTVDNLVALTPQEIDDFKSIGVSQLIIDDTLQGVLNLSPEDQAILEADEAALGSQFDLGLSISDTAVNIEGLSPQDIANLGALGIDSITSTDSELSLSSAQVDAAVSADIDLGAPAGESVTLNDTSENIESMTPQQIADAAANGVSTIQSSDGSLTFSVGQEQALADNFSGFDQTDQQSESNVLVPDGDTITVSDTVSALQSLDPDDIKDFATLGVSQIDVPSGEALALSLDQAEAYVQNDIGISSDIPNVINDTAENLEGLDSDTLDDLQSLDVSQVISTDGPLQFDLDTALAILQVNIGVYSSDGVSLDATSAELEGLDASEYDALKNIGFTSIESSDGPVSYSVDEAISIGEDDFGIGTDQGNVVVSDTAADFLALTPDQLDDIGASFSQLQVIDTISDLTSLSEGDLATLEADNQAVDGSGPIDIVASDTAENIESLTPDQIDGLALIGVTNITATDDSVDLSIAQIDALTADGIQVTVPENDDVVVVDTAANIEALTDDQIQALANSGLTSLVATNGSVQFDADQAVALADANISVSVPENGSVSIVDDAGNIEALTADELAGLGDSGFTDITANDGSLQFDADQALALANTPDGGSRISIDVPDGSTITLSDSAQNLLDLTAQDISDLKISNFTGLTVSDSISNLDELTPQEWGALRADQAGLGGSGLTIADDANDITTYTDEEIANLAANGVTSIQPIDVAVGLDADEALVFGNNGLSFVSGSAFVSDSIANLLDLTAPDITTLGSAGISALRISDTIANLDGLTPADQAIINADNAALNSQYSANVVVSDTAANIEALTPAAIDFLASLGVVQLISTDAPVSLGVAQIDQLVQSRISIDAPIFTISDTAANLESFTPGEISGLNGINATPIQSTDGSLVFDAAQASAFGQGVFDIAVPSGDTIEVSDVNTNIEDLTPQIIDGIHQAGFTGLAATGGSLSFDAQQAIAAASSQLQVTDASGAGFVDTSATIEGLQSQIIDAIEQSGFGSITSTDGSLNFNLQQAEALSDPVDVNVPGGDTVTLLDTAANIESLTPEQIFALASVQFTGLTSTDEPLVFDTAQMNAINQTGLTVSEVVACYCAGTLITTETGDRAVETLAIGDKVLTAAGVLRPIKWIGRRSYGDRFVLGRTNVLPVCFKAGSLGGGLPRRDLWISPHHAMYFREGAPGGVLIEAKDLINGVSIVQAKHVERIEYIHVELDSHDVIIAEGAFSETFVDDDSRGIFHNAGEYAGLYPENIPAPARYCATRLDVGREVEVVRNRIAQRAGLLLGEQNPGIGELRGRVDVIDARLVKGWAQNIDHLEAPVCLDIHVDRRLVGHALANHYRRDLKAAGLGSGRHAFVFELPDEVVASASTVEVRRSLDGNVLHLRKAPAAA